MTKQNAARKQFERKLAAVPVLPAMCAVLSSIPAPCQRAILDFAIEHNSEEALNVLRGNTVLTEAGAVPIVRYLCGLPAEQLEALKPPPEDAIDEALKLHADGCEYIRSHLTSARHAMAILYDDNHEVFADGMASLVAIEDHVEILETMMGEIAKVGRA